MKTILLPTDFSNNALKAAHYAIDLFKNEACKFYIMHALELQASAPSTAVTSKRAYQAIHDSRTKSTDSDLANALKQSQELASNPEHTFKTKLVNGSLLESVQAITEDLKVDLVVIGNKGASAIQKATFGSNAAQLILKISCPIIAVPETADASNLKEIGFATDFTIDKYGDGMNLLKEIAQTNDATISVVNVVNKSSGDVSDLDIKKRLLENALKPLSLDYFTLTDVPVEMGIHVFSESRKLGMLALITKKRTFFQKLTTRSHSKAISHNLDVPLIVFDQRAF